MPSYNLDGIFCPDSLTHESILITISNFRKFELENRKFYGHYSN